MNKEQIIDYLEYRLQHATDLKEHYNEEWKKDVCNDNNYSQYLMWYAVCVTLEDILKNIK